MYVYHDIILRSTNGIPYLLIAKPLHVRICVYQMTVIPAHLIGLE